MLNLPPLLSESRREFQMSRSIDDNKRSTQDAAGAAAASRLSPALPLSGGQLITRYTKGRRRSRGDSRPPETHVSHVSSTAGISLSGALSGLKTPSGTITTRHEIDLDKLFNSNASTLPMTTQCSQHYDIPVKNT